MGVTSSNSGGNTNLNPVGSNYARTYGHGETDLIARMFSRKRKKKMGDSAPKQFYVGTMLKKRRK